MKPLKQILEEEIKERLFPYGGDSYDFDFAEFEKILKEYRQKIKEELLAEIGLEMAQKYEDGIPITFEEIKKIVEKL